MIANLEKLFWIARYTFLEVSKSKFIYAIFGMGILIWIIAYIASEFTYGVPQKVSLDFGLGLLSLSNLGVAIFLGATLIYKEIENRTVYIVLTKPTSRSTFIIGKILGLLAVIVFNAVILSFFTLSCYFLQGGEWSSMIFWAILFTVVESMIVMVVVIFFSLLTNPILTSLYGIGFAVVAHALSNVSDLYFVKENPALLHLLKALKFVMPNLDSLNLRTYVLYEKVVAVNNLGMAATSALFYIIAFVLLCCYLFSKKQFE